MGCWSPMTSKFFSWRETTTQCAHCISHGIRQKLYSIIWRFPEIGVPPNHPIWGIPMTMETPISPIYLFGWTCLLFTSFWFLFPCSFFSTFPRRCCTSLRKVREIGRHDVDGLGWGAIPQTMIATFSWNNPTGFEVYHDHSAEVMEVFFGISRWNH